jgi:L-ribulose-5-phosphate 4-epimerase
VAHLSDDEVAADYEANTGHAIVRRFADLDHRRVPGALLAGHAPFCWGPSVSEALETMSVLEEVARLAYDTVVLDAAARPIPDGLRDKHFFRKHGPAAYYGQPR